MVQKIVLDRLSFKEIHELLKVFKVNLTGTSITINPDDPVSEDDSHVAFITKDQPIMSVGIPKRFIEDNNNMLDQHSVHIYFIINSFDELYKVLKSINLKVENNG